MASYISMSAVATIASWLPTVLEVARLAYIAQRNSWDSLWLTELPARATPEFQFKERFLVSLQSGLPLLPQVVEAPKDSGSAREGKYIEDSG